MTRAKTVVPFLCLLSILLLSCDKHHEPKNMIPVANAGPSKTITIKVAKSDTTTLTGSGTDSDGQIVAYLWSQVSGPSSAAIAHTGSPSTLVEGLIEGSYIFQLMVTDDKGATGVDTTTLTVFLAKNDTLTLQPVNNPTEFEYINHNGVDESGSGPGLIDIPVEAWTSGGSPYTVREAIKFDLSNIPANATIISANLYLYSYPSPTSNGNLNDANYGTQNSMLVQQIITNWSPTTTNWFNQPVGSTTNQIIVPATSMQQLDLNLDVKNMIGNMVSNNTNYGFFLKLENEIIYNSRIFVSSYSGNYPNKRPKLVVVYQ